MELFLPRTRRASGTRVIEYLAKGWLSKLLDQLAVRLQVMPNDILLYRQSLLASASFFAKIGSAAHGRPRR